MFFLSFQKKSGDFLVRMGAVARLEQLISRRETSDDEAEYLLESFKKIIDVNGMGRKFKVLGMSVDSIESTFSSPSYSSSTSSDFHLPGFAPNSETLNNFNNNDM